MTSPTPAPEYPWVMTAHYATRYDPTTRTYTHLTDQPTHADVSRRFDTLEEAQACAASFPKSWKLKATRVYSERGDYAQVTGYATLAPTKGNPVNETGVKRVLVWMKRLDPTWHTYGVNSYAGPTELLDVIQP